MAVTRASPFWGTAKLISHALQHWSSQVAYTALNPTRFFFQGTSHEMDCFLYNSESALKIWTYWKLCVVCRRQHRHPMTSRKHARILPYDSPLIHHRLLLQTSSTDPPKRCQHQGIQNQVLISRGTLSQMPRQQSLPIKQIVAISVFIQKQTNQTRPCYYKYRLWSQ